MKYRVDTLQSIHGERDYKVQDTKHKVQDTRYKRQNTEYRIQKKSNINITWHIYKN